MLRLFSIKSGVMGQLTRKVTSTMVQSQTPILFKRSMANRFPRRRTTTSSSSSSSTGTAVQTRPSAPVPAGADAISSGTISGTDAQMASIRLPRDVSIKVDPSSIVSVPLGVEVRPIYGAPVPIEQLQQQQQQSGGFMARLRSAQPSQPQLNTPILAEILLQPGQPMPADSIQLAPATNNKLQTINLNDYGNELYIQKGTFLASSVTVNVHEMPPSAIPGLQLQKVDGEGSMLVKVSGQPIVKDLFEGEQIFIQANRLVAVESTVQVLGGPQQLLTNVVGPGKVLLQSLPSLETALVAQAQDTQQALQAQGIASSSAMTPFSPMGMGGGLGSMVMQGAAFGVGSAIAHRAFDSAFGGHSTTTPAAPPADAPTDTNSSDSSPSDSSSGEDNGSFFGSMFGGDDSDGGGDDGGDGGDW